MQTLAMQIRVMRQKKDLTQKELASELGTSQNAIYRLENPKGARPNVSTLERLAAYFDVALVVRFAPFSELSNWTLNLSAQSIDVPPFDKDVGFIDRMDMGQATSREVIGQASRLAWAASGAVAQVARGRSPQSNQLEIAERPAPPSSNRFGMYNQQVVGL